MKKGAHAMTKQEVIELQKQIYEGTVEIVHRGIVETNSVITSYNLDFIAKQGFFKLSDDSLKEFLETLYHDISIFDTFNVSINKDETEQCYKIIFTKKKLLEK